MADATPQDRANKAFSLVLRKMPHGTGNALAEQMGVSAKELSEIKTKFMEPCLLLLAHLNLKIVGASAQCLTQRDYDYLTSLHQRIARENPKLCWDDADGTAEVEA